VQASKACTLVVPQAQSFPGSSISTNSPRCISTTHCQVALLQVQ
jgi:hypothetical protein